MVAAGKLQRNTQMAILIYKNEVAENAKKTVMEGYEEDIIDILVQDQREEKKQRRTAKVIFKELKKLGYQGSYRTVRGYVRKAKEELRLQAREQFAKLEHFPR